MTAHALMMCGEALEAFALVAFLISLAERARERRAVRIPVRSQQEKRK